MVIWNTPTWSQLFIVLCLSFVNKFMNICNVANRHAPLIIRKRKTLLHPDGDPENPHNFPNSSLYPVQPIIKLYKKSNNKFFS